MDKENLKFDNKLKKVSNFILLTPEWKTLFQETLIHFTTILYLKEPKKGGNLKITNGSQVTSVRPKAGTLVLFTSGQELR